MLKLVHLGVLFCSVFSLSVGAHDAQTAAPGATASLFDACESKLTIRKPAGGWANKVMVLDTNIIFNDPNSIYRFPGATIVIPGAVLSEVGKYKSDEKLGRAARQFIRTIRDYIDRGAQTKKGIDLGNGSVLKLDSKDYTAILDGTTYDRAEMDNRILATAISYMYESPIGTVTYLVTDDGELMIKANGEDIPTMGLDYQFREGAPDANEDDLPLNYVSFKTDDRTLNRFKNEGRIDKPGNLDIRPNQFVMLFTETVEGSQATLGRYFYDRKSPDQSGIRKLMDFSAFPIQPKNIEQAMLLDILLDPTIHLVVSQSPAGTGKTFLAIVAGLLQMAQYDRLLVTRTLVQIGKTELGAMPGKMEEKLSHWMPNVDDAFEALAKALKERKEQERLVRGEAHERGERESSRSARGLTAGQRKDRERKWKEAAREAQLRGEPIPAKPWETQPGGLVPDRRKVEMVPFPHIRGRSISDAMIILDEAQNTSVHEMKTFLTRAGEGTKMIILGDATQIDSPFLNERNNGLTVATNLFLSPELSAADASLVGHVHLTEGVRSELADLARRLFEKLLNGVK